MGFIDKIEDKLSGSKKHDEQTARSSLDQKEPERLHNTSGSHEHSHPANRVTSDEHYGTGNTSSGIGLAQSSSLRHPVGSGVTGSGITGGTAVVNTSSLPGSYPGGTKTTTNTTTTTNITHGIKSNPAVSNRTGDPNLTGSSFTEHGRQQQASALTGNTTSGGLTGHHGSSNTDYVRRPQSSGLASGTATGVLGTGAAGSGLSGQGSHLHRDGRARDNYSQDQYVDNRSGMEKIKDKVIPSRTEKPDDAKTGLNYSQQTGSTGSRAANSGSGASAHNEYGVVQSGRGQYPGGDGLRETEHNSPRQPLDAYNGKGQQAAANQRWGNDGVVGKHDLREAGDIGSRSHVADDEPVRRSRDGGITNGMSDLHLKSGPHPHPGNPSAVPIAGGHKVGGIGESSNGYDRSTGQGQQHHYGRDPALAGGAGVLSAGAATHHGSNSRDRDTYVDNRSGLEKVKDKVIPGRTDRPDDPITGQNYSQQSSKSDTRAEHDDRGVEHRSYHTPQYGSPTHSHQPYSTTSSGPTGYGQNVSYLNRLSADEPLSQNRDFNGPHNTSTGAHLGSRDTTGAAATSSVLGHDTTSPNSQHHYGRDAALAGGAGALGAGAAHHHSQERGNGAHQRDSVVGGQQYIGSTAQPQFGTGIGNEVNRGYGGNTTSPTGAGRLSHSSGTIMHTIDGKKIAGHYAAGYEAGWRDAIEHMQSQQR